MLCFICLCPRVSFNSHFALYSVYHSCLCVVFAVDFGGSGDVPLSLLYSNGKTLSTSSIHHSGSQDTFDSLRAHRMRPGMIGSPWFHPSLHRMILIPSYHIYSMGRGTAFRTSPFLSKLMNIGDYFLIRFADVNRKKN